MSPRSAASNEAMRAESRARIVEHALRLFAERGFEGTTVRAIAESAGISQGLLYNYFAGKDELLLAIFDESMRDVEASFARAERAEPGARTAALVRAAFDVLQQNRLFWRLSYGVRMQSAVLAGLGGRLRAWTATIRDTLERYLRDDGFARPELEAAVLFALIDGVAQHYLLDSAGYPLDEVLSLLLERYAR